MMMAKWFYIAVLGLAAAGCSSRGTQDTAEPVESLTETPQVKMPEIPATLTDVDDRLHWLVEHYWDCMEWRNDSLLTDTAYMEQSVVNWLDLLGRTDSTSVAGTAANLFANIPTEAGRERLADITLNYLYSPTSPMYNPELLLPIADGMGSSMPATFAYRPIADGYKSQILKNRVGGKAADFTFRDTNGAYRTLAAVAGSKPMTLVLFYDPDCNVCDALEHDIAANGALTRLMLHRQLTIMAIDPFGTDRVKWLEHAETLPSSWIVGQSPEGEIDDKELYVIRATPVLYLLDQDRRVLLKDVSDLRWTNSLRDTE